MKKNLPNLMLSLLVIFAVGCKDPLAEMAKIMEQQQLTVEPNPLELHGGNVGFTLSAKLPVKMMKKGITYGLEVDYVAGDITKFTKGKDGTKPEGVTKAGVIELEGDKYAGGTEEPKVSKKMNFAYEEKHEQGFVIITGVASKGKKSKRFGPIAVTSAGNPVVGVATTSRLVRNPVDGISNAAGKSPFAYAQDGWTKESDKTTSYNINFEQGSARVTATTGDNKNTIDLAKATFKSMASQFAKVDNIPEFKASGVSSHSPEGRVAINQNLPGQRSSAVGNQMKMMMKAFDYGKKVKKFDFQFDNKTLEATWPEFKTLVQGSSLNEDQKTEVVGIVDGSGGFVEKEKKLQGLAYYNTMMDEIYPKMRYAKMDITVPGQAKTKADMENILDKIVKGEEPADKLTETEFLYMAANNPNYTNRVKWLEKAVTKYDTWKVNNNLGAAYLDVALLTKDNSYVEKALASFEKAKGKKESGEIYYNMGMAYLMKGDNAKAEESFKKAVEIGAGDNPAMTGLLNGIKGYYAIQQATSRDDGKYKEAYELLASAASTVPNYFNKGLAYLLEANDYEQAKASFNAAAKMNDKDATTFYALAVVAARQGNEGELTQNLKKAVELKSDLKAKALKDAEFFKYKTKASFMDAIK